MAEQQVIVHREVPQVDAERMRRVRALLETAYKRGVARVLDEWQQKMVTDEPGRR